MRNAKESDVKKAIELGQLANDVMYKSSRGFKVHGVSNKVCAAVWELVEKHYGGMYFFAETDKGDIVLVEKAGICPIKTGPAQQPRKPRRKPVKGTKPEQLLPMSADVKLKVGDRVVLANGSRTVILQVDNTGAPYQTSDYVWHLYNGECVDAQFGSMYAQHNITHKIIPWQKQSRVYIDGKLAGTATDLKITPQKSPEQEAFEKGCWVPHSASHSSVCPPFAAGWKVDYLMRNMQSSRPEYAESLRWNAKGNNGDIVAYRKAKQQ